MSCRSFFQRQTIFLESNNLNIVSNLNILFYRTSIHLNSKYFSFTEISFPKNWGNPLRNVKNMKIWPYNRLSLSPCLSDVFLEASPSENCTYKILEILQNLLLQMKMTNWGFLGFIGKWNFWNLWQMESSIQ